MRQYRPDPVPAETVTAIVDAAQRASTSSNLQMWTVIAVTGAEKRRRLAELCGNQRHIAEAPVFLAWCADLARLDRACELRGYAQVTEYVENFLVAAADVGHRGAERRPCRPNRSGWASATSADSATSRAEVIELLEMPRLTFPVTGMTLGWPAANPPIRPRLDTGAVLHWEHYDTTRAGPSCWPRTTRR